MDTKVNYTFIGFFIIAVGILGIVLLLWLSSFRHRETYDSYLIYSHEEVSGLSVQSPVRYNGVRVGYVDAITLNAKDPQQVILKVKIKRKTPITISTVATIMAEGLTGVDYIGLTALASHSEPLVAKPGEPYPVIPSEPSLLLKLSTALQEMTQSIRNLSDDVGKVFDEKNRLAIQQSLANIASVSQTIAKNNGNISQSLANLKEILVESAKASRSFPEIAQTFKKSLAVAKNAALEIHKAGEKAVLTFEATKNTIQTASEQLMPPTQQIIDQLNVIMTNLQQLSNQVTQNPAILLRGQKPPPPGPGE